jgi:hypothetical protein
VTKKLAAIDVVTNMNQDSRRPWKRMVPSKSLLTAAGKKGNLFETVFGRQAVFRAISAEQRNRFTGATWR